MGKFIPIIEVYNRKTNLESQQRIGSCYPLYETYKTNYNFENIRESVYNWKSLSDNTTNNFNKVLELFEFVSKEGTQTQLEEITSIINRDIIPYVKSPAIFKNPILKTKRGLDESTAIDCLNSVLEKIHEQTECDRVLRNCDTIAKRFNIDKIVKNNILFEDAVPDTIYKVCSLIDTYTMDFKTKYCIALETCLYSINKYAGNSITRSNIIENVTDYFLMNGGTNDINKFLDKISEAVSKDNFINISEDAQYINKLKRIQSEIVNEDNIDLDKLIQDNYRKTSAYGLTEAMEQMSMVNEALDKLCEEDSLDKIHDIVTKVKMAPVKTNAMTKEAIRSILVTSRLQDLNKGTRNSLSLIFYTVIVAGALAINVVGGLFAFITAYIMSKHLNKEYLKESIKEWKEHKYSVTRKLKEETDPEKKRKLEAYLDEVDKSIETLEEEYEKQRDKTMEEINRDQDNREHSPDYNGSSSLVNPLGKETPQAKFKNDKNLINSFYKKDDSSNTIGNNSNSDSSKSSKKSDDDDDDDFDDFDY